MRVELREVPVQSYQRTLASTLLSVGSAEAELKTHDSSTSSSACFSREATALVSPAAAAAFCFAALPPTYFALCASAIDGLTCKFLTLPACVHAVSERTTDFAKGSSRGLTLKSRISRLLIGGGAVSPAERASAGPRPGSTKATTVAADAARARTASARGKELLRDARAISLTSRCLRGVAHWACLLVRFLRALVVLLLIVVVVVPFIEKVVIVHLPHALLRRRRGGPSLLSRARATAARARKRERISEEARLMCLESSKHGGVGVVRFVALIATGRRLVRPPVFLGLARVQACAWSAD